MSRSLLQRFFPERAGVDYGEFKDYLRAINIRLLFWAGLMATFGWTPFLFMDQLIHPDRAALLAVLRLSLTVTGLVIVFASLFRRHAQRYSLLYLGTAGMVMLQVAPAMAALTQYDTRYVSGYLLAVLLSALFPFPFFYVAGLLALSFLQYLIVPLIFDTDLYQLRHLYDLNNVYIAFFVTTIMHYAGERIRLNAYNRERRLINMRQELKQRRDAILRDLHLAQTVQRNLLPKDLPRNETVEMLGMYESMEQVGGDFYDVRALKEFSGREEDDRMAVFMADASGHGVPAALIASMARLSFYHALSAGNDRPDRIFDFINRDLMEYLLDHHYMTGYIAVLEPGRGVVQFCNASHRPALAVHPDGRIDELDSAGDILCMFDEARYEMREYALSKDLLIFFYTDGLEEANDERHEHYGRDRLKRVLHEMRDFPPQDILRTLRRDLDRFTGGRAQDDDVTMLLVRIKDCGSALPARTAKSTPLFSTSAVDITMNRDETLRDLIREERYEDAEYHLRRHIEADPHNSLLWFNRAYIAAQLGDVTSARRHLNRSFECKEAEVRRMKKFQMRLGDADE